MTEEGDFDIEHPPLGTGDLIVMVMIGGAFALVAWALITAVDLYRWLAGPPR